MFSMQDNTHLFFIRKRRGREEGRPGGRRGEGRQGGRERKGGRGREEGRGREKGQEGQEGQEGTGRDRKGHEGT
jgi:hypothetical protein